MSITFNVCGVAEVSRFAGAGLTDIVSIGDPAGYPDLCKPQPPPDFAPFADARIHRFEFQDIHHLAETSPTPERVSQLIALADEFLARAGTEDVRVLYHCQAGRSRSTAAAFILCVRAGLSYQDAYQAVLRVRGFLDPNLLMLKYADIVMNQGGKMLEFAVNARVHSREDAFKWYEEHRL